MNNQEIINRIIYISSIIGNKGIEHDERVKIGIEACEVYEKLKIECRTLIMSNIYIIYRQMGALYFEANEYSSSEKFFEKSLEIKTKYNNVDSMINECTTKQMLAREKIMIYLNSNNSRKLEEAKTLLNFIDSNYDISWNNNLKEKIDETKNIYNSAIRGDLKTIVTLEIPYHLILDEENEIGFNYKGTKCYIKAETIRAQESNFIIGDNIYTEKDKYGIVNRSIVTLTIEKYINGNELIKVNKTINEVYRPLNEAINVYNYFLKKCIISTGKYWLPEINENMIFRFKTKVLAGNVEIKNIPLSISMSLSSSGNNRLRLKEDELKGINKELNSSENNIWELAVNYAKDYYLIKDYKNAIIMINIALENFTYYFSKKILKKYLEDSQIEKFFRGIVEYEDYFLKEYISKKNFEQAKKDDVIKDNPPTIYKIYAEIYKYEQLPITKNQLNKKLSKIKDQRNEIVHGQIISKDLQYVAEKAIEEFENIVKIENE